MTTTLYRDYLTARLTIAGYSPEQIDDALLMAEATTVTLTAARAAAHGYHRPLRWVAGGHEVEPAHGGSTAGHGITAPPAGSPS